MVGAAATFKFVFDYKPEDVFFCTADCGWITGHRCAMALQHSDHFAMHLVALGCSISGSARRAAWVAVALR